MATRGNGKGRNGGAGDDASVPRWVRTLFDLHEAHMAALDRSHEETKATIEEIRATSAKKTAEHEARMARLERSDLLQAQRLDEARRQTRELIREVSRVDAERKMEAARNRAEDARNRAEDARNRAEFERNEREHRAFEQEHRAFMAAMKAIQDKASSS